MRVWPKKCNLGGKSSIVMVEAVSSKDTLPRHKRPGPPCWGLSGGLVTHPLFLDEFQLAIVNYHRKTETNVRIS